ncbi:MAG: sugar kinase [Propionibacterium sp.]|nr:sugar kinase [Propionibacterium sp.]
MSKDIFLGVDIGTSSSKGVAVDGDGNLLATAVREHRVDRPAPGIVEMDGSVWWDEFCSLSRELLEHAPGGFAAVSVSGMGPCVQLTDADNHPTTPSALYGVDTRATAQIAALNAELGADAIYERSDSYLSNQSAGPKFRWFAAHRPEAYERSRRFHMPASLIVARLTGEYVLDRQSASQSTPLYDAASQEWARDWAEVVAPGIELPRLAWAGDQAGVVHAAGADAAGLREGTPVAVGTIDAWAEGLSVGAVEHGDLMLMYGTTMFFVGNTDHRVQHPSMWGTTGLREGQWNMAGGMATSGAITSWLRELFGNPDFATLVDEAAASRPGARGLLMLPYFEGERTPIQDPFARGTITGLTIGHTRGDLYRAALEATAYGVRHNIETYRDAGVPIDRIVAVGGGTQSALWPQIVSDATGLPQVITEKSVGAAYGDAFLAARLLDPSISIREWNPAREVVEPRAHEAYAVGYGHYRELYEQTKDIQHALARAQRDSDDVVPET